MSRPPEDGPRQVVVREGHDVGTTTDDDTVGLAVQDDREMVTRRRVLRAPAPALVRDVVGDKTHTPGPVAVAPGVSPTEVGCDGSTHRLKHLAYKEGVPYTINGSRGGVGVGRPLCRSCRRKHSS